jgi:hypothetical protein
MIPIPAATPVYAFQLSLRRMVHLAIGAELHFREPCEDVLARWISTAGEEAYRGEIEESKLGKPIPLLLSIVNAVDGSKQDALAARNACAAMRSARAGGPASLSPRGRGDRRPRCFGLIARRRAPLLLTRGPRRRALP